MERLGEVDAWIGSLLKGLARCKSNVRTLQEQRTLDAHLGGGARAGPVRTDTAGPVGLRRGEHWCGGGVWQSPLLPGDALPQTMRPRNEKKEFLFHTP